MRPKTSFLSYNNKKSFEKKEFNLYKAIFKLLLFYGFIIVHQFSIDINKENFFVFFEPKLNKSPPKNRLIEADNLKVALCTMGKRENNYAKEFIDYYVNLGVDQLFIYDDNDPNTERISDILEDKYKPYVTIYENMKDTIKNQSLAFTTCYHNNIDKFDWFIMIDMDEFLYIVNDTLKDYLVSRRFDECDFLKFHWVTSTDNNLVHYDPRPLFERFKSPFVKDIFVKTLIRGNIPNLTYWVHSPDYSPFRNTTCNNLGEKIKYDYINIESVQPINIDKAFLIHFRFKSTEELITKFKRGYSDWFGDRLDAFVNANLVAYFEENELTLEKLDYIEKELNVHLSKLRLKYYLSRMFYL